ARLSLVSSWRACFIPAYATAAVAAFGPIGSLRPLALGAAGCLAVTAPWFLRNALVFGHPLFTANPDFFGAQVGDVEILFGEARPRLLVQYTSENVLTQMARWTP